MLLPSETAVRPERTHQVGCKSSDTESEDVLYTKGNRSIWYLR